MTSTAMFASHERGLALYRRGKVRDVYRPSDEHLIIVACDRISAFDHVLPTPIPDKGKILTQISNFWFEKSAHIIANHIVDPNPGPRGPEPISTPSTKAQSGHDENISFEQAAALVGADLAAKVRDTSLALYRF